MNARPAAKKILVTCDKCNGSGYLAHFAGYADGVCFVCNGTGKVDATLSDCKMNAETRAYVAGIRSWLADFDGAEVAAVARKLTGLSPKKLCEVRAAALENREFPGGEVVYQACNEVMYTRGHLIRRATAA